MNYMSVFVNHNVSIVSVFYLEKVANNGIRRHGFYEVRSCFLEVFSTFIAILVKEVFIKSSVSLSTKLIS